jgi:DNA-binding CsgD family transcriptional regulator
MLFQPVMYTLWNALTFAWAVKAHGSGFFAGRSKRGIDAGKVAEYGLSEREAQLVRLVADGASNKEIGGELGISANTARNHVHNIFQKTGARNRVELVQRLWSGHDD